MSSGRWSLVHALVAADVGDPSSTRRVYLVIAGLVVLGGLLAAFTVWYWRSTRPEPPALGRLEAMGLRRWEKADYEARQTQLDDVGAFDGGDGPVADADADVVELESVAAASDLAHLVEATEATEAASEWDDGGPLVPVASGGDERPDPVRAPELPGEPLL